MRKSLAGDPAMKVFLETGFVMGDEPPALTSGMELGGAFTIDARSVNVGQSICPHDGYVVYVQYGIDISDSMFPTQQPIAQASVVEIVPPTVISMFGKVSCMLASSIICAYFGHKMSISRGNNENNVDLTWSTEVSRMAYMGLENSAMGFAVHSLYGSGHAEYANYLLILRGCSALVGLILVSVLFLLILVLVLVLVSVLVLVLVLVLL